MALSDIVINEEVQNKTNAAIYGSNYRSLRQYLLERKPLLTVTNAISTLLAEHRNTERQEFVLSHTLAACESQSKSDQQDALYDEQEQANDAVLKSSYSKELPVLESTISQLEIKCFIQQNHYSQVLARLAEYKISLAQVNKEIERNSQERSSFNTRYPYSYPQANIHALYSNLLYPQTCPTSYIGLSIQEQIIWERLINEDLRLVAEQQRLMHLVDVVSGESKREESRLLGLQNEKKHTEERYSEVKGKIDVDLPNKEKQRLIRKQERFMREAARKDGDSNLLQLSPENREILKQKIATQDHLLESKCNHMMDQVMKISYSSYLHQLELILQQKSDLQVNFKQCEALKLLISMMKNYSDMEAREQIINNTLHSGKIRLAELQKIRTDCNKQLNQYIISNPEIIKENEKLKEDNNKLALQSESATYYRNLAFYSALFGVGSSLISGGILSTLLISPLFFSLPGILGLFTIVSIVVTIVSHFQKVDKDGQIDKNKVVMSNNEATIFEQCKKATEMSEKEIPALNAQISDIEKEMAQTEQELKQHHKSMNQLLSKAENITDTTYGKTNTFFTYEDELDPQPLPTHESASPVNDPQHVLSCANP